MSGQWLADNSEMIYQTWIQADKNIKATWKALEAKNLDIPMVFNTFRPKVEAMLLLMDAQAQQIQAEPKPVTEVTTIAEGMTDQDQAVIMALRDSRAEVKNGRVPSSVILERYNELVHASMKVESAQVISNIILRLTKDKAFFKVAKYNGRAHRCLMWDKTIINLINGYEGNGQKELF